MKSDALLEAFLSYLQRLLVPLTSTDSDPQVMLFGSDEFGFAPGKSQVRLKEFGWMECPGITKQIRRTAKWAVLVWHKDRHKDEYEVIFGRGNPFEIPADQNLLPTRNGVIPAIPLTYVLRHRAFMSEYRD
ncbi:hypothetical protein [Microvirga massiliensis]|uniref:hypothetical protein n=1 Tax=Microvirga massiliensis TaxID=1033741 RepID=UPI00062BA756|nr:hypothetical protein [Microvirga massiliensis]